MKQTAFLKTHVCGSELAISNVVNALAILVIVLGRCTVTSAEFALDWSTIDAGGGTSTGGVYAVSGTIGQPEATTTTLTGGPYSLAGGFWSIIAIPTPGAPLLSITLNSQLSTIIVSWPSPSTGWYLQQNTDLNTANWVTPPENVADNGTQKFIIVNPSLGNRFYRLHKP